MSVSYYYNEAIYSAGGVLLNRRNNQIFLLYKNTTGEWLLPKGRIEDNESIEATARREIMEETGYRNDVVKLLSVQTRQDISDPSKSKVIFWFLSILREEDRLDNSQMIDENFSGKWVKIDEAENLLKWDEDKKLVGIAFKALEKSSA